MEKNVGGYDRIARLVAGMGLLVVGIAGFAVGSAGGVSLAVGPIPQAAAAAILLLVGATLVVTGYLQQCPISGQLGIDTVTEASR